MDEQTFTHNFKDKIKQYLPLNYEVEAFANLYYQLTIDNKLELEQDPKLPQRGSSAFQTDILISEKRDELKIPKVVIELKGGLSTHDVITYSSKAVRHKRIYPYLRYGLLVYNISSIPGRFFTHNEGIDCFIAYKEFSDNPTLILQLIREEIEYSDRLEKNIFENNSFNFYTNIPIYKTIQN